MSLFCDDGHVLYLCCPIWQPLAACGHWALEMWHVQPGKGVLNFINLNVNSHMWLVATVLV